MIQCLYPPPSDHHGTSSDVTHSYVFLRELSRSTVLATFRYAVKYRYSSHQAGHASPELTYFITGDLFLLTTFTHFTHTLVPSLLATTNQLSVSTSLFCFICKFV